MLIHCFVYVINLYDSMWVFLEEANLCRWFIVCSYLGFRLRSKYKRWSWNGIIRFSPATFNIVSHTRNWISNAICRDSFVVQLFKVRGEHGCSSVDIDGIVDHHCIITILNVFLLFVVLKLTCVLLHVMAVVQWRQMRQMPHFWNGLYNLWIQIKFLFFSKFV